MEGAESWEEWRSAWQRALYGPAGFYRQEQPHDHFRTAVSASVLFAEAVLTLVRREGVSSVTDLGAGDGRLLAHLRRLAPDLALTGVDLRRRPAGLDPSIEWQEELPTGLTGLVLANELLDNVPCDVVELDGAGELRMVEVDLTGAERLGAAAPEELVAWCRRWWPLDAPGQRAEIGLTREDRWADVCSRSTEGVCVAIDYGHVAQARPALGTLSAYREGRQVRPVPDGSCDVTAHVAVDALAERVGGELVEQRAFLGALGVSGRRPPMELASEDPLGYVRALARSSEAAELVGSPGLGDFRWLLTRRP